VRPISSRGGHRRTAAGGRPWSALLVLAVVAVSGCTLGDDAAEVDPTATVVELSGSSGDIDFDDIVYSAELRRVLVPAGNSGVYLVEPTTAEATRVEGVSSVDSVDAGEGVLFVLDRSEEQISVVDPQDGKVLATAETNGAPDYVRYVEATGELWVAAPGASPSGIEVFALGDDVTSAPRRVAVIEVPDGPEGLVISESRGEAYAHAGDDLVVVGVESRRVTQRWPTGCDGTHGFPRVAEEPGVVLASCAEGGEVRLLGLDDGRQLGQHSVGGGESLPAYSASTGHFYVGSDPGTTLATLALDGGRLSVVREVIVPADGHCLIADEMGHYWTCDPKVGRILRFDDP
jgi:DNA-binding beta-propeller fold protein YncE